MDKQEKRINFRYNLKEYWKLLKKYKFLFFTLFIISFILSALAIIDKFLFKRIIDNAESFLSGTLTHESFVNLLIIIGIIFLLVVLIRSVLKWFTNHLLIILDSRLILDLKQIYFKHILGLSHNFHTNNKTGSLITRMIRGGGAVEGMTDIIVFNISPLIFNLIVVGISISYFNLINGLVLILMSVIFISYSWFIQRKQEKYKLSYNQAEDKEKAFISDVFTNIDSIKYFGKEKLINKKYSLLAKDTKSNFSKYFGFFRWFDSGQVFILGIGLFFLILFPLMNFLKGELTIGELTFIYTAYSQLTGPLFGFVFGLRRFYRSMADFQELFEYGKIQKEVKDKPNSKKIIIKNGKIEFKNVSFNYGKKKAFSLDNFNLKIKPNEKIAFVGHSGCGKTTLIKLLYRLHNIQEGEIKIDNQNIEDIKQESLRSEMSIVPQEAILFDDTIYNNIKFANPRANKKQVMNAIKFAQLDKIINNLPQKENTIVGERGIKLSGGEKQRVSIARAILANKKVLILDEATSALDSETENQIQKSLSRLLKGRTSIIIAHRLSTIMNADRIIVMKNGKIIQQGKHKDLIKKQGEYKKLWNLQKGGYIK
ncbi:MAG: ABC transporter ATP-binding protein [Nanoarchaeota archaeon]